MGFSQRAQTLKKFSRGIAVLSCAAMSASVSSASGSNPTPPPAPTPEPTPEPTEVPRPDVLNIKKRTTTNEFLEREWLRLTLLKDADLPGLKQVPEFADALLRKRISESFGFPAVMTMRDPLQTPPVWWSAEKEGIKALTLGPTRRFTRPELQIEVPMLRLREVPYLVGDSEFTRTLNEIVRLWTLGRLSEAIALRDQIQKDKKKLPRGTLERTTIAILSGYLDLQAALNLEMPVERYGPALGSFWDALGSTELSVYISNIDNKIDQRVFNATLAEPAIFSNSGVYPPKLTPPQLLPRSMDMITFIRTLALPSVFNVASLAVKAKNWTRVYEAAQRFEEIYARLDKTFIAQRSGELNFTTPPGVSSTHPIMMWPRTPQQMKLIIQMLKVKAQFIAEDPLMALKESAKVILGSEVAAFKTIGFTQAGNIYDDLGYPNYARRFYAFAEAFANTEWYEQNPYFLLNGGENAFWAGDFAHSKKALEKFILAAGDKNFGPWARLRLAEIAHLTDSTEKASILYEELYRLQKNHQAGKVARRRLFCINAPQMGSRERYVEYQSLKEHFAEMEQGEIEQIRACYLNKLVEDATKMAENSAKTLPDDAAVQLDLIEEFQKIFPKSSYLKFFEERKTTLQTALGPYYLAFKQCGDAIDFFKKNEDKIASLKKNSQRFLPLLKWKEEEHDRLLRCAALFASHDVLSKLSPELVKSAKSKNKVSKNVSRNTALETTSKRIIRLAIEMTVAPSDKLAQLVFQELRKNGEDDLWSYVRTLEEKQSQSIDDEKFWIQLASLRLMQWDLEQPAKNKKLLRRMMRQETLRRPDKTLEGKELCDRFLLESATLSVREWDVFVLAIPTDRWLELLKPAGENQIQCAKQVATEALRVAQTQTSLARDRHLLWPWLKEQGALKEQEAWLALGTRWAREGSVSKQELEELFKTLEKEADSPSVREAARAWRESGRSGQLW